jgi:hypothetical protein
MSGHLKRPRELGEFHRQSVIMIPIRAWGPMFATARKVAPTANRAIAVVSSPVGPMPTTLFLWASEFILPATLPDPKNV